MPLPLYLAMTAAEMAGNNPLPPRVAFLSCHFSPCSQGLSNLPEALPPGAMLVLDDSMPPDGHDPDLILKQLSGLLERHNCESLLLDFQRPGCNEQWELAKLLSEALPCPVGVSELYADELSSPVLLPPVPADKPLKDHLTLWAGRETWLEAALDGLTLTLTESGCACTPLPDHPDQGLQDEKLHCHYFVEVPATFHLWRTREDLDELMEEAKALGVSRAVGLWQELHQK